MNKPNKKVNGYILVYAPTHPFCNKDGYVAEHRLTAELLLGRFLLKQEVIHHIDFNKTNNDIRNLMLFPSNKEHMSFHRKMQQFGMTRPIQRQINQRWVGLIQENLDNV